MTATEKHAARINLAPPRQSLTERFQRWEWFLVLLILLVVVVNSSLTPFFLRANNLFRTSSDFMELGLMMLPMVFIITTGNVDLSVASTMGMTASFMGWLFNQGVNIWIAAGAALLLGLLAGMFNGFLTTRLKVPALVITLGTFAFYRGIAYVLLGDQAARGYPKEFLFLGQGRVFGTPIPFSVVLFAVLAVIFGLVLHKTTLGRYLYAIGSNADASVYSGVPVDRVKMIIFSLSGVMSALAGIILAARFASTRPDIGLGLELTVITATVLGGVDIRGGKGTMVGAVLALVLVGLMRFGMGLVNIQGQTQSIAIGLLLILSILLPNIAQMLRARPGRQQVINRRALLAGVLFIAALIAFGLFFFWSRAVVFSIS